MKRMIILLVAVMSISSLAFADTIQKSDKKFWKVFSKNLGIALKSDNDGLREAAMVNIVRYKDKMNPNSVVFPLVDIYRNSQNEKERELAVAALINNGNIWGIDYLKTNFKNEKNANIRHLVMSYVNTEK